MLNIALFGPPGAGKGTQSEFLISKYDLFYISTGDLLRKELTNKTKLGLEAQDIIASGGLVPDEIIVQIIENTITGHPDSNGFLFDGFPRTYIQAYILEGLMLKLHTSLDCLISLTVPEEVSIERLTKRGQVSARVDDNELVIKNRLKEYYDKTLPVLRYYKDKGILYEIDGTADIEKVKSEIQKVIKHVLSKKLFNLVLFGYPGSGRSSQGKALAEKFGLEFVTTGEMLHQEIQNQSGTGKKIEELYAQSLFVPDEIVVQLIERKLENSKDAKGFIFKGFPRTLVQSYILDGLLKKYNSSISLVIEFEVPTLELIQRLDQRSQTSKCKPYDTSASKIIQRMNLHEKKTVPVIERYDQLHTVTKIDGVGSSEEVFSRLSSVVEKGIKHIR